MNLHWALVTLLTTIYVNLGCTESKMRTLHFGPVPPPAPGEKFDKRHWLKSAMPKKEQRCPKKDDQKGTASSVSTDAACATITTYYDVVAYPTNGKFTSPLERLEFTVQTTDFVDLYLKDVNSTPLYFIVLGPMESEITSYYQRYEASATEGIRDGAGRFWVAITNSEIQVGKDGSDEPMVRVPREAASQAIWSIGLRSGPEPADWQIYMPCY